MQQQMSQPQQNYAHRDDQHYLVEDNNQIKCVCELCSCGKHKCPRPRVKGQFETSYNNHYKNIQPLPRNQPHGQYQYQERHYNPDVLKTNYQENYPGFQIDTGNMSASRFENVAKTILAPHVPFQGSSSYKDQYKPFVIQPTEPNPQSQLGNSRTRGYDYGTKSPVKFEGISSYKAQYVPPEVKFQKVNLSPMTYKKSDAPFYGSSSYKNDFQGYKVEMAQGSFPSNHPSNIPKVKFQGNTSYHEHYPGYKIQTEPTNQSRVQCVVDTMQVPPVNYINQGQHIYYNPQQKKFI